MAFSGQGAVSGGASGASIGTAIAPGIGTIIGGIIGAAAGGLMGGDGDDSMSSDLIDMLRRSKNLDIAGIRDMGVTAKAAAGQSAVARGLSGSTIVSNAHTAINQEMARQMAAVTKSFNESITRISFAEAQRKDADRKDMLKNTMETLMELGKTFGANKSDGGYESLISGMDDPPPSQTPDYIRFPDEMPEETPNTGVVGSAKPISESPATAKVPSLGINWFPSFATK